MAPRVATRTKASIALERWAETPGNSQGALARALGISQPSVSSWVRGTSRPEGHLREAIELLIGIPVAWWATDEEHALVERVRADVVSGQTLARVPDEPPPLPPKRVRRSTGSQPSARSKPARAAPTRATPKALQQTGT